MAAFRLARERQERLVWQVVRVEEGTSHHFRLVIAHPERVLDLGLARGVKSQLDALSSLTTDQLRDTLRSAESEGLQPVKLRHVREAVDYWRDDFWNWLG